MARRIFSPSPPLPFESIYLPCSSSRSLPRISRSNSEILWFRRRKIVILMPVETFRSSTFTVHTRDAPRQSFSCDSLGGKRGNDSIPKLKFQRVKKSAANTRDRRNSRDRVFPGRSETSLVTPLKSGRSTVDRPGRYSFSEGRVTGHVPLVRPLSIGSDAAGWFSRVRGGVIGRHAHARATRSDKAATDSTLRMRRRGEPTAR